jgi:hypothetical protein
MVAWRREPSSLSFHVLCNAAVRSTVRCGLQHCTARFVWRGVAREVILFTVSRACHFIDPLGCTASSYEEPGMRVNIRVWKSCPDLCHHRNEKERGCYRDRCEHEPAVSMLVVHTSLARELPVVLDHRHISRKFTRQSTGLPTQCGSKRSEQFPSHASIGRRSELRGFVTWL